MSRQVVLVLVAILFIVSIPLVSADAYPIEFNIEPKTTVSSLSYSLEEDDVFGVSISITGYIDIQIDYGRGRDVKTWRNVTGDFMGNMTIEKATTYYIDFYNLDSNVYAVVTGWIVINDFIPINVTTTSTTSPFNTTPTTNGDWLQDWSWLIPPLMLVSAVLIIIIIGYVCRGGRGEDLHFLLNLEESLFGLPEEND